MKFEARRHGGPRGHRGGPDRRDRRRGPDYYGGPRRRRRYYPYPYGYFGS